MSDENQYVRLSPEDREQLISEVKDDLKQEIYAEVGKTFLSKIIFFLGTILAAVYVALKGTGHA